MREDLIKSYETCSADALKWAKIAEKDVDLWNDKTECIMSLSVAYANAGRAKQCASILAHDYGMKEYITASMQLFEVVGKALETIRERLKGA